MSTKALVCGAAITMVLGLAIAEAHLFPTGWEYDPTPGSDPNFGVELERAGN